MLRLARVLRNGNELWAVSSEDDRWVLLTELEPSLRDWLDVYRAGPDKVRERVDDVQQADTYTWQELTSERVLDPVATQGKVVGVGLNYRVHAEEEFGQPVPDTPLMFAKWPSSVCGAYDTIPIPQHATTEVDYEVELAVVIGETSRDVDPADVPDVVAGFTVGNDLTARDVQRNEAQWTRAKSFDGFCPLGPTLALGEYARFEDAAIYSLVNGETRQNGRTSSMVFSIADIVSHLSQGTTLEPGDVILTGTPAGVAMGNKFQPQWLKAGDVVECGVEGLGLLKNTIV